MSRRKKMHVINFYYIRERIQRKIVCEEKRQKVCIDDKVLLNIHKRKSFDGKEDK